MSSTPARAASTSATVTVRYIIMGSNLVDPRRVGAPARGHADAPPTLPHVCVDLLQRPEVRNDEARGVEARAVAVALPPRQEAVCREDADGVPPRGVVDAEPVGELLRVQGLL